MKRSKTIIAAVALAAVVCTAAGCVTSGRSPAPLASNWYYDPTFKGIQSSFMDEGAAEKLTYTVKQTNAGANALYSVEYADGTYTTQFYAKKITAAEIDNLIFEESWRDGYKQKLSSEGYLYLYYFSTALSIPSVTYKMSTTGEVLTGTDEKVLTESYFLNVDDYLAPVYTQKTVKSLVPSEWQPAAIDDCFVTIDRKYESCYSLYGEQVSTVVSGTMNGNSSDDEKSYSLGGNYSVFDSTFLPVVARAMRNRTGSMTATLYTAGDVAKTYNLSGAEYTLSDEEETALSALLAEKNLFKEGTIQNDDGTTSDKKLGATSVTVSYSGGEFSGVSQSYIFAATDGGKNTARALMVKYSQPLDFNLGRLDYVLTSIDNLPAL